MSKRGYVADFETNTSEEACRVWAYAISDIDNPENVIVGNNIDDFMAWCMKPQNKKVYFHNLKFDAQFILSWLFKHDYKCVNCEDYLTTKTFTTIISDLGMFYELDIMFNRCKNPNRIKIIDSLKLIPLPVSKIAKSFKMPISKLEIDYNLTREENHNLTKEEIDYVSNDVKIVAYAIRYFLDSGLTKLTIGSCALSEYKEIINKKYFKAFYPIPTYDKYIRPSYRGGFTYLSPKFEGKIVKEGIVLDYNSLYPSVMYNELLPYGEPIHFEGEYEPMVKDIVEGKHISLVPYAKSCVSSGDVSIYVKQLDHRVKIFTHWDEEKYMLGCEGDYLAVRTDDLSDVYAIEKAIFEKTYIKV